MQCSIDEDRVVGKQRSRPVDEAEVMQRSIHEVNTEKQ